MRILLMMVFLTCVALPPSLSASPLTQADDCPETPVENSIERTWLEPDAFSDYLETINITGVEIPPELGRPFLAVDWDSDTFLADRGRLLAIGFEALSGQGGWGTGTLQFATYDFAIGAEYDLHAQPEDYEALQSGRVETDLFLETEDETRAYITYTWHPRFESIVKKTIFPFPDYYVAVVTNLAGDYRDNHAEVIDDLVQGDVPEVEQCILTLMDDLAASLSFADAQFPDDE